MTDLLSALFSKWAFRKLQRAGYLIKTLYVAKSEALTPESATHQAVCGWASRCRKSQWCCKMLRQKASICSRSCRGSYMSSTRILFWFFFFLTQISYRIQHQLEISSWSFTEKFCLLLINLKVVGLHVSANHTVDAEREQCRMRSALPGCPRVSHSWCTVSNELEKLY